MCYAGFAAPVAIRFGSPGMRGERGTKRRACLVETGFALIRYVRLLTRSNLRPSMEASYAVEIIGRLTAVNVV
jgi:hypothetical protein